MLRDQVPPRFNPIAHPICLRTPRWLPEPEAAAFAPHIPFAFLLIDLLRPKLVVQLGEPGASFSAFCQAVDELPISCSCVLIEPEKRGTELPGKRRQARDDSFAKRIRSTPEGATDQFPDGSIDLLHLEGVGHLELIDKWLGKLSRRGVVLLHGTGAPLAPGAPIRWEELRLRYPVFQFEHGRGLGAIFVGAELPPRLDAFLEAATEGPDEVRRLFVTLGEAISTQAELARLEESHEAARATLALRDRHLAELRWERDEREHAAANLKLRAERAEAEQSEMMKSRAWKVTAPLRFAAAALREIKRSIRRRSIEFDLQPLNDLAAARDGRFNWISFGPDPFFAADANTPKPPKGWVHFSVAVEADEPAHPAPRVYLDNGTGYSEATSLPLQRAADGQFSAIARLLPNTNRIRFDPLSNPGRLLVGPLRCREIGALEALTRLCWPHIGKALRSPRIGRSYAARLLRAWRHGGLDFVWLELEPGAADSRREQYAAWVRAFDTLGPEDRAQIETRLKALDRRPTFSVVMPVYNPELRWLRRAVDSVAGQWYPDWELCIADDASTDPRIRVALEEYALGDARIRVTFRKERGNISAASNSALALARGDFVALLDHDDELREHALLVVAEELSAHPDAELVYSDEDKLDGDGNRFDPYFKPDWNPDLIYSQNFVNHLGVYRRSTLNLAGAFREGYEGAQDYDLVLRFLRRIRSSQIRHIPHVLYHWRAVLGSTGLNPDQKEYAHEAGRKALRDHFVTGGERVVVEPAFEGSVHHRVVWPLPARRPLLSVIIPTRDRAELLEKAVQSCLGESDYPELEVLIVDHESVEARTQSLLNSLRGDPRVQVLRYRGAFNFSAINNFAIENSNGELIALLNNDVDAISPGWLREMVSHAVRPEIGAVGGMLYYPDNAIQHAGVILGVGGVAGHAHKNLPRGSHGHGGRARLIQNFSAVTGACLMTRREVLDEAGLLDEGLQVAFNDIDLCLRIRARGYRVLWTPYAEFHHFESASRGSDQSGEKMRRFHREVQWMQERWGDRLTNDPYYNPNLSLVREDFSFAFPPRVQRGGADPS